MKHTTMLISILAIAACGGKRPEPKPPEEVVKEEPEPPPVAESKPAEPEPPPEPDPGPAAPPPTTWHAQAELTPVKGAKIKATATVTFRQEEGQPVSVASTGWFDGLKAGKYHLLVHQNAECGNNASKAGKAIAGAAIPFAATKGMAALEVTQTSAVQLDGDAAIVGHTLVLHDDKRGKPGKALACGPIASAD